MSMKSTCVKICFFKPVQFVGRFLVGRQYHLTTSTSKSFLLVDPIFEMYASSEGREGEFRWRGSGPHSRQMSGSSQP